jgi:hypothetical protein
MRYGDMKKAVARIRADSEALVRHADPQDEAEEAA